MTMRLRLALLAALALATAGGAVAAPSPVSLSLDPDSLDHHVCTLDLSVGPIDAGVVVLDQQQTCVDACGLLFEGAYNGLIAAINPIVDDQGQPVSCP